MGSNILTDDQKKNAPETRRQRRSQAVQDMIEPVQTKLIQEVKEKGTLGDYIKLIQLEKDLADDEPAEIKVTWVDPEWKESDG
jgi:hypothetical protein